MVDNGGGVSSLVTMFNCHSKAAPTEDIEEHDVTDGGISHGTWLLRLAASVAKKVER